MTGHWVKPLVRCSVYLYFAAGMTLLANGGAVAALRYQADKTFPATFLLVFFVAIFGLLAFASWNTFQRPISRRKWILLCIVSSLGILVLLFAPPFYGSGGGV